MTTINPVYNFYWIYYCCVFIATTSSLPIPITNITFEFEYLCSKIKSYGPRSSTKSSENVEWHRSLIQFSKRQGAE